MFVHIIPINVTAVTKKEVMKLRLSEQGTVKEWEGKVWVGIM